MSAIVLGLISAAPASGQNRDRDDFKTKYGDSILFIETYVYTDGPAPVEMKGTGFVVQGAGWVLTNNHLYQPPGVPSDKIKKVTIKAVPKTNRVNTRYDLEMVTRDPHLDLMLLRLPERAEGWPALDVADSNTVKRTDPIVICGFALGKDLGCVEKGFRSLHGERGRFVTEAAINHGNSGGPVLSLEGKVVAVVFGGVDEAQAFNYVIPINYARGLLRLLGERWK